jgi:hypothetical protein
MNHRPRLTVTLAAMILTCGALAHAGAPQVCSSEVSGGARAPPELTAYLDSLGNDPFDLRSACTLWAAGFSGRHQRLLNIPPSPQGATAPRLILFPAPGVEIDALARLVSGNSHVAKLDRAQAFVVAHVSRHASNKQIRALMDAAEIAYAEPDCDGPDFVTTSLEVMAPAELSNCWRRAARDSFPNDPCIDELWGHRLIGWDSTVAAHSVPRVVAVLDSGIDSAHEDLANGVLFRPQAVRSRQAGADPRNAFCATARGCFPHGTEMAGTIAGRMDNGIGVAGVAPNSRLLPIVIARLDHGHLARLSTIAQGIDAAVEGRADVINISARWPVDSRAIGDSIRAAVSGPEAGRRLVVTGYATALDSDETVREYYPSKYRCLPGVLAAVPGDMRGHDLFNPKARPNANDGRIQAPGVDIVVTTTDNSERGYALSQAAGASSAAAYVSGVVALVWGSPPLTHCGAQEIKQLLFCRSKSSNSTRYPWIHVDFLRELSNVDPGAGCRAALATLGCD